MAATPIEPVGNIAFMAAILSVLVSVNLEFLTAMPTLQSVVRFALHLVEVTVPPLSAALVGTKPPWLPFGELMNNFSAVLTTGRFPGICHGNA